MKAANSWAFVALPLLLAVSLCAVAGKVTAATEVTLTPRIGSDAGALALCLRVDGREACRFVTRADESPRAAWPPPPLCHFQIGPGAKAIEPEGQHRRASRTRDLKQTWWLRDLAPVTRSLYEPDLAFSTRVRQLLERAQHIAGWDQLHSPAQLAEPAQLDAIEQRLATPLPSPLRDLHQGFGAFTFGGFHHRFAGIGELGPIAPVLRDFGDHAALADPELQPSFARSVFVAMEGGDGIGYIGFQPAPNAPGAERAWSGFHQDGPTFEFMRDDDGALDNMDLALGAEWWGRSTHLQPSTTPAGRKSRELFRFDVL